MAKLAPIIIPTEPIGSIPRRVDLSERIAKGDSEDPNLAALYEDAIRDTIERFEATGAPVVTDREQRKYHNFRTYCVQGLPNTESLLQSTSNIEMPEQVRDRSFEPGKNWRWCRERLVFN
jgi:methionine synthase II (cobalamin-independent)